MLSKCADAVQAAAKAAGKPKLTAAGLKGIEDQLSDTMRRLARQDPARWRSLTEGQRIAEASTAAMQNIQAAAQRKADNAVKQVLKVAETEARLAGLQSVYAGKKFHDGTRAEALKRDIELTHIYGSAVRREAQGGLMKMIEAAGDKQGAGLGKRVLMSVFNAENRAMTRDVVREIFKNADGHSGNQVAKDAARAWLDTIEGLRQRFNAAGGDVGQLEYGYTPQPHDRARVRKAGADAWAQRILPRLDRSRYLREDGSLMSSDELLDFLRKSWETITTDGLNKSEPGQFKGSGKRADRHGDARQIHFADGEAWADYMAEFGRGSLYDAMMGHINGMARDIAIVERYGPDANANARLQFDLAARADGREVGSLVGAGSVNPQTLWDMVTGKVGMPVNETLARNFEMARNLQTAAKLGSAVISSVTDLGTLVLTAGYNRLPYWQMMKDIGSQASKDTRDFMSAHGMIAESVSDALNRWSGDHLGSNWSGKLANAVMRGSLLNAWTDGLRQGFVMTMNAGLARMAKSKWADVSEFDRSRLQRAGITEADWATLNATATTNFKGRELLTPQGIRDAGAPELAARVFGFINDEAEFAVVNPDLTTRAVVTMGGQQAGTWGGEIARTVMQFKSFPIAMMSRHWRRMLEGDHDAQGGPLLANRSSYAFALMVTTMALGATATQTKEILKGKDPISMDPTTGTGRRFWAKAIMQGGGLSIMGDLFLVDPTAGYGDQAANAIKNIAGPSVGSVTELLVKNVAGNAWEAASGKDTHIGAELSSWVRSNTPGASLWWVRPMIDHGFMNALNENLSPGYLSRMQSRAAKDWQQQYWWAPRDAVPRRAPDLGAAVGQ